MIKKTDAETIRDAKIQTVQDEADATIRDELRKSQEAVDHRAAADDAPWESAKFTAEEFRATIPPQPKTRWQRFKSWIFD